MGNNKLYNPTPTPNPPKPDIYMGDRYNGKQVFKCSLDNFNLLD